MNEQISKSVSIQYCPKCKWLARAAWYAQEILSTYVNDIVEVRLVPSTVAGEFRIDIGSANVMDRSRDGFLEAKLVKRRIRDIVAPARSLGHVDE